MKKLIAVFTATICSLAWGQVTGSQVMTTTKLPNVMFGQGSNGTSFTTKFFVVNRDQLNSHGGPMTIIDGNSNWVNAQLTDANGNVQVVAAQGIYSVPAASQVMFTLQGATPSFIATPVEIDLGAYKNVDGFPDLVASALVQQYDANGNLLTSIEVVDPTTISASGNGFILPLDPSSSDTVMSWSNFGSATANITVTMQPGFNLSLLSTPPPSVSFKFAPGMGTWSVSQLFANAGLASFFAQAAAAGQPLTQNSVLVTSDQPVAPTATRLNGTTKLMQTPTAASFPTVPLTIAQQ